MTMARQIDLLQHYKITDFKLVEIEPEIIFIPYKIYLCPAFFSTKNFLQRLKSEYPIPIEVNIVGDTYLHLLCRSHIASLKRFIQHAEEKLTREQLNCMAKIINNNGESVLSIINNRWDVDSDIKLEVHEFLKSLAVANSVKPLHQKIKFENICNSSNKNYFSHTVQTHLKIACDAANAARAIIEKASTHPGISPEKDKHFFELSDFIEKNRNTKMNKLIDEMKSTPETKLQKLSEYIKYCKEFKTGRCEELATLMMGLVHEKFPELNLDILYFNNECGDHTFLAIGLQMEIDRNYNAACNQHAVICDPLLGEVYPIDQLRTRMVTYLYYNTPDSMPANLIQSYNPFIHTLHCGISIKGEIKNDYALETKSILVNTTNQFSNAMVSQPIAIPAKKITPM